MLKHHKFYLNMTWLFIMFVLPLPLVVVLNNALPFPAMGINFGIYAYVWMLAAIYLAAKPKWLDRLVGLPDMYLIHGIMTILALVLAWVHGSILSSEGLAGLSGYAALYLFTAVIVYSLVFMAGWLTNRVRWLMTVKRSLEKTFKHELTIWVHRLNLLATALIYVHILAIDYVRSVWPFTLLATLYTVVAFGSYCYSLVQKHGKAKVGTVAAVDVIDGITHVSIQAPKAVLGDVMAGDFIHMYVPAHKGLTEPHPFSVANVPNREGMVKLALDGVGDFTKEMQHLQPGETVKFTRGNGILNRIIATADADEKFVFMAGGIGIVPLIGLTDAFPERDMTYIYSVREDRDFQFNDKFDDWEKRANFRAFRKKGIVTPEEMAANLPLGPNYTYIIAGPMGMNMAYQKLLAGKGINENKIYFESFNF